MSDKSKQLAFEDFSPNDLWDEDGNPQDRLLTDNSGQMFRASVVCLGSEQWGGNCQCINHPAYEIVPTA